MFYKWLVLLFLAPVLGIAQTHKTSIIYSENGLWGLKDGKLITPAVYDTLIPVNGTSYFIAKKHHSKEGINATGVISNRGKVIIPFTYLQIIPTSKSFLVKKWHTNEVVYGVLSYSNKVILATRFKRIRFLNNYWVANSATHNLQLYNAEGVLIKQLIADSISLTNQPQFMYFYKRGKVGLSNYEGKELFAPKYKSIEYIQGKWSVELFNIWRLISSTDTVTIEADSLLVWNAFTSISIINNKYQLPQTSKAYNGIQIVTPSLAIYKQLNKYGVIALHGNEILPPIFSKVYYKKGYFYTLKDSNWSVYDSVGIKKSVFSYNSIGVINNGLFPVKRKGKWGFMNRNGKEVIHCIYDNEADFIKGKAIISYFGVEGIINLKGDWIVKPNYKEITGYSYNFFIYREGYTYYLKNYANELIYFSRFPLVFKNEIIFEIRPTASNEISSLGIKVQALHPKSNQSSYWKIINVGKKYGFVDTNGLLKITYRYDSLQPFSESLAAFKLRGKWGFINNKEQIIIQPIYTAVTSFKNLVSIVTQNNKKGVISTTGKYILNPKFDAIRTFPNYEWLVKQHQFWGVFNSKGAIIIQPNYTLITYINPNLIIIAKNNKYGVVDANGVSVLPRIYDYIGYNFTNDILILKQKR